MPGARSDPADILAPMPRRETTDEGEAAPAQTLRSQQVEATRRAVLAAARAAFGTQGYAQTSVDEIAAAARVTKGAVYHHFAGKEALFRAVWGEVEAEATARAASAGDPNSPPIDQLVAEVDAYLEVALDEEVRRITLIDGPVVLGLEPEGPVEQHPGHLALRAFIGAAIGRGELRDLDPGVFAHLVGGLALLGGLLIARAGDPETTRATVGQAIELMLRALGPSDP
jgi:AcrR family transcriptional regulator